MRSACRHSADQELEPQCGKDSGGKSEAMLPINYARDHAWYGTPLINLCHP